MKKCFYLLTASLFLSNLQGLPPLSDELVVSENEEDMMLLGESNDALGWSIKRIRTFLNLLEVSRSALEMVISDFNDDQEISGEFQDKINDIQNKIDITQRILQDLIVRVNSLDRESAREYLASLDWADVIAGLREAVTSLTLSLNNNQNRMPEATYQKIDAVLKKIKKGLLVLQGIALLKTVLFGENCCCQIS